MHVKIVYTCPAYPPSIGGVETHVAQIAARLATGGHHVEVLTEQCGTALPAVETVDGVIVRRFQTARGDRRYAFAPGLWRYIVERGREYDIVHAHSYHAFTSLAASLVPSRPLVFTPHYHGTGSTRLGRVLHLPYRAAGAWLFHRASRVICVSRAESELVLRHFPFAAGRTAIIPNGVDVDRLQGAEPFDCDTKIVFTTGRLKSYKGVHRLIEALGDLDPSYRLHVAGDGPALPNLRAMAARRHMDQRIRFLGPVDDMTLMRWYRTARVFVSMSEQEAFGLTVLESLAAGTPVVASDIAAHREVRDMTGSALLRLIPLEAAPAELARAIEDAVAGSKASGPSYLPTWDSVAGQTVELYHSVLHQ